MDEVYNEVYSRLYDATQLDPRGEARPYDPYFQSRLSNFPFNAELMRRMIYDAEREAFDPRMLERVRPDARLFLLTNLFQMVALPAWRARRVQDSSLLSFLFTDTVTLLKQSAAETRNGEISSHSVLKAVDLCCHGVADPGEVHGSQRLK